MDFLVETRVALEIKAVDAIDDVHRAQLLSYLKFGGWRLAYLSNFDVRRLKDGINRMVLGL